MEMDPVKVKELSKWLTPRTKNELHSNYTGIILDIDNSMSSHRWAWKTQWNYLKI